MRRLGLVGYISLIWLAGSWIWAAQSITSASSAREDRTAGGGVEGRCSASFHNGTISVACHRRALQELTAEITRVANLPISVSAAAGDDAISVNIRALSVEEALRVILIGHDAFFLYSAEASGRASLRSVWAYRKGEATGFQPAAPEALQSAKEIRVQLQDSNPRTRTRAFRALLERTGSEAAEAVAATVMQERDDAVRGSMIEAVRSSGIELPAEMWGSLTADPAEHIRLLALDALQGAPGLREFATTALSDSSPHVRQRAQEIINELEAASGVTRSAP